VTHRDHHKHTNHPEHDPDYSSRAPGPLSAIWQAIQNVQPRARGGYNAYGRLLKRLGRTDVLRTAALYRSAWFLTLFALAWSGHAIEAAALWWLPHHVGYIYIQYYLSWAPHHPANETARYRHTRSFRAALGNIHCAPPAPAYPFPAHTRSLLGNETGAGGTGRPGRRPLALPHLPASLRPFPN